MIKETANSHRPLNLLPRLLVATMRSCLAICLGKGGFKTLGFWKFEQKTPEPIFWNMKNAGLTMAQKVG
jgi:hypothetical protein